MKEKTSDYNLLVPRQGVGWSFASIAYTGYLQRKLNDCITQLGLNGVYSAIPIENCNPSRMIELDGGTRLFRSSDGDQVQEITLCCTQAMSSFGNLIAWDAMHTLPVGGRLTIIEPSKMGSVLERRYFRGALKHKQTVVAGMHVSHWTKTNLLPSDLESGLDEWSFCLPMQRPTQAVVDEVLANILSLKLKRFELLVASSEPFDKHPDSRVKIFQMPESETSLTAKKNSLAQNANFSNLCIFHDRVVLPKNFFEAMRDFGDHYGLVSFQSLYVDREAGEVERYSDFHVESDDGWKLMSASATDSDDERAVIYRYGLPIRLRWRSSLSEAHPGEASEGNYLTGSMYIAKRSTWRMVEQHPEIDWDELEDVEFGLFALKEFGIPSRLNPLGFTLTRRARAIMLGSKVIANRRSAEASQVTGRPPIGGSRLNGRIDASAELVIRQRAWEFAQLYCLGAEKLRLEVFGDSIFDRGSWARYWLKLLYAVVLPRNLNEIEQILRYFSRAMYGSPYDRTTLSVLKEQIWSGKFFIDAVVENAYFLRSVRNHKGIDVVGANSEGASRWAVLDKIWRDPAQFHLPSTFAELTRLIDESVD